MSGCANRIANRPVKARGTTVTPVLRAPVLSPAPLTRRACPAFSHYRKTAILAVGAPKANTAVLVPRHSAARRDCASQNDREKIASFRTAEADPAHPRGR